MNREDKKQKATKEKIWYNNEKIKEIGFEGRY